MISIFTYKKEYSPIVFTCEDKSVKIVVETRLRDAIKQDIARYVEPLRLELEAALLEANISFNRSAPMVIDYPEEVIIKTIWKYKWLERLYNKIKKEN